MNWIFDILVVIPVALLIWFTALITGALLALPVTWARVSRISILRVIASVHIEVFRGVPTLVWLFVVYFGLQTFGLSPTAIVSAILALGVASSAYIAEIYRSGLSAVPSQQKEATTALGLPPRLALMKVVLPQAKPIIFAGLGSYAVHLFKETALTSLIGVVEIMMVANYLVERGANGLIVFFTTGIIYMLLCLPIAWAARQLGQRSRRTHLAAPTETPERSRQISGEMARIGAS